MSLELVGEIGLGLLGVDEDLGLGLLGFVVPLGLGDLGLGLEACDFGFLAGLGDGRVALGRCDLGLAQGVDVALGIADVLEGEGKHGQAHAMEVFLDGGNDALGELLPAPVDLLDGHAADDFADLALEDVGGHMVDGLVGGVDLDLGHGLGHDRHAAARQDLGCAHRDGDDVHGQDVDLLHAGPDEDAAAQPIPVTDLLGRSVGHGDCALAAPGDDQGLVGADLPVAQGQDEDEQGEKDDDGAGNDEPGYQGHDGLLIKASRIGGTRR